MGMFDEVLLEYNTKRLSKYKGITFQTKSFDYPSMDKYKIDNQGRLLFGVKGQKRLTRSQEIETFKSSLQTYRQSVKNPNTNLNFFASFFKPKDKYYKSIIRKWKPLDNTMTLEIYTYIDPITNEERFSPISYFIIIYLYLYNGKVKKTKVKIDNQTEKDFKE